jgi:hypothetical protein
VPYAQRIVAVLVHEDIQAAQDFLVNAFGFQAGRIDRDDNGRIVHCEVLAGVEVIWLHRVTTEHRLVSPRPQADAHGGLAVTVDDLERTGSPTPPHLTIDRMSDQGTADLGLLSVRWSRSVERRTLPASSRRGAVVNS